MVRVRPPPSGELFERQGEFVERAEEKNPTAASFYVKDLPGFDLPASGLSLYAGNIRSSVASHPPQPFESDAHLYFLLAQHRHIPQRERLVIWFQGGPGCSGFDGSLVEIGPLRVNPDGTLREVKNTAWNEYANVLFLDQPAGTGFSYVSKHDNVRELAQAAEQVVIFLSNLYRVFPELAKMDTYLAGESYAGQYIPYVADAIHSTTLISTRLKGAMIGNGWIDPRRQYPAYLDYVLERGLITNGAAGEKDIRASLNRCEAAIAAMEEKGEGDKGMVLIGVCEEILGAVSRATMKDGLCLNSYDTSKYHACGSEWPPALTHVTPYLRRPEVVKALHAEGAAPKQWTQCSPVVGSHFWTPNSVPAVQLLPKLLEKMPILLYNGDLDLMCAGTGIESMIANLEWNGLTGFNASEKLDWSVDSKLVGEWTTARNLSFVTIFNASHMVPMDAPAAAHDMLLRFMQVDTLHAAGHAALVPSRIGKETEAVLGATHPNGSTLPGVEEAAAAEQSSQTALTDDGFNKDHELLYGPRRTMVLFLLLALVGGGIWFFIRWSRGRRRERYRKIKGKGRARTRIRLPEDRAAEEGTRSRSYPPPPPPPPPESFETVAVFDVGVDFEEEEEESDHEGDIGRGGRGNPWQEDRIALK